MSFGDAHVHLFNAADLPIGGFLRFVVLPAFLPDLGSVWEALIDLVVEVIKPFAISAEAEQARLFPPWQNGASEGDVPPSVFADRVADRIEQFTQTPKEAFAAGSEGHLHDSYVVLGALLAEGKARSEGRQSPFGAAVDGKSLQDFATAARKIDRAFLARVAQEGERTPGSDSPAPKFLPERALATAPPCPRPTPEGETNGGLSALWATLKWAYEMMRPRCAHMRSYLRTIEPEGTRCALLINLLVDYDAWLDDHPTQPASGHDRQVAFWTRYAEAAAPRLIVKTFAGYDPLKHCEERLSADGCSSAYLAERKRWWLAGKTGMGEQQIAGLKLYPPMGFKPSGNGEPALDRSGERVRARWKRNGWPIASFGAEIDRSLDIFFTFAGIEGIPLLAHAYPSQEASCGTGAFATPDKWISRIEKSAVPLRVCLAHYAPKQFEQWVPSLLAAGRKSGSQIFFDVAYADEFLTGEGHAILDSLERACGHDAEATGRFLFGSDWIMLGRNAAAGQYTQATITAVDNHDFWRPHKTKLFEVNLRSFLQVP
jgi:hypothetical protein